MRAGETLTRAAATLRRMMKTSYPEELGNAVRRILADALEGSKAAERILLNRSVPDAYRYIQRLADRELRTAKRLSPQSSIPILREAADLALFVGYHEDADRYVQAILLNGSTGAKDRLRLAQVRYGQLDYHRARDEASQALGLAGEDLPMKAEVLRLLGLIELRMANKARAKECLDEAHAIEIALERGESLAEVIGLLGAIAFEAFTDVESARRHFERSLGKFRERGNLLGQANQLAYLASIHYLVGRYKDASSAFERSAQLYGRIGSLRGQAKQISNRGLTLLKRDRPDEAEKCFLEAMSLWRKISNNKGHVAAMMGNLGLVAKLRGDRKAARRWSDECLSLVNPIKDWDKIAREENQIGLIEMDERNWRAAEAHFERSIKLCKSKGLSESTHANASSNRGAALSCLGAQVAAKNRLLEALKLDAASWNREGMARALCNLSDVARRLGDRATAKALAERAGALAQSESQEVRADVLEALGKIAFEAGDPATARRHWQRARSVYRIVQFKLRIDDLTAALDGLKEHTGDPLWHVFPSEPELRRIKAGESSGAALDILHRANEVIEQHDPREKLFGAKSARLDETNPIDILLNMETCQVFCNGVMLKSLKPVTAEVLRRLMLNPTRPKEYRELVKGLEHGGTKPDDFITGKIRQFPKPIWNLLDHGDGKTRVTARRFRDLPDLRLNVIPRAQSSAA